MASVTGGAVDVASPITTDQLRENGGNYRLASGAVRRVAVLHDEEVAERGIIEGLTTPVYIVEEGDPLVRLRGVEGGSALPLCMVEGGSSGHLATPVIIIYGSYGGSMRIQDATDGPGTMGAGFNERALVWLQDPGAFQAVGYLVLQPPEFTAVAENYNKVKITITKPPIGHYDGYILDRYNPEEGQEYFDYDIVDADKNQGEFYDQDIPNDRIYQYRLRTFIYDSGQSIRIPSAPTPLTDPVTIINVPAAGVPTDFTATLNDLSLHFEWVPGAYSAENHVDSSDDNGATWNTILDFSDQETSYDYDIQDNGTFKFRMWAANPSGTSGYTATRTVVVAVGAALAPTSYTQPVSNNNGYVQTFVAFPANHHGTSVWFEYSSDNGITYLPTQEYDITSTQLGQSATLYLPDGHFKIRARLIGPGGASSWLVSNAFDASYLSTPSLETGFITNTMCQIRVGVNTGHFQYIKILSVADTDATTGTELMRFSYTVPSYSPKDFVLTGLTANHTYFFRAVVVDATSSVISNVAVAETRND